MAMTVWISATTTGSSYGARPHVAQLGDLHLNGGAAGFQVGERVRHEQPPSNLAYHYASFEATKKDNSRIVTSTSHTHAQIHSPRCTPCSDKIPTRPHVFHPEP